MYVLGQTMENNLEVKNKKYILRINESVNEELESQHVQGQTLCFNTLFKYMLNLETSFVNSEHSMLYKNIELKIIKIRVFTQQQQSD